MSLVALILTDGEARTGPDGALLMVAGQTLIEYQARLAARAGARHIVMMIDQIPPALVAALDRLRDDGISIQIARDAADAADRTHPDENLLVIAAGAFAPPDMIGDLAASADCRLLTLARDDHRPGYERIDGEENWAGFALLRGRDLRVTAAMLGEWDLAGTLVRAAVQQGCLRQRVADAGVRRLASLHDAEAASHTLAARAVSASAAPFDTYAVSPLARRIAAQAMAMRVPFELVSVIAPVTLASAATLGALGFSAAGFAVLLVALILGNASALIASAGLRRSRLLHWRSEIEFAAFTSLILSASIFADRAGWGWGTIVIAIWIGFNLLEAGKSGRRWLGEMTLAMLVATAADLGPLGLGTVLIAQLAIKWRAARPPAAAPKEDLVPDPVRVR